MEVVTLTVGMYETNCYLAYDRQKKEGIIIDPGDEAGLIIDGIKRLDFKPRMILLTHGHVDHIGAVNEMIKTYSIPLKAGRGEEKLLKSAAANFSALMGAPITCPDPEQLLDDGDKLSFGSEVLTVRQTPGHSPGGVCYVGDGLVFCGDTLFYGSVGRTDFPGCSHQQLIKSIVEKLLPLPDKTVCYPGHGPTTTIGEERRHNPFLQGNEVI